MNLRGSYRALRDNSKAALMSAIEIYNKPRIDYRDECFSILLINAWELVLKAALSKNKQSIYYTKQRNLPYRTLSLFDALKKAEPFFPSNLPFYGVFENLTHLIDYRNKSVHFCNQKGFSVIIYNLAQASILNYRDFMFYVFNSDVADEITLNLLPLSLGLPLDPIEFIKKTNENPTRNKAVSEFVRNVTSSIARLEDNGVDVSRLLTYVSVKLESTKKITKADVLVGVTSEVTSEEKVVIKRFDPNDPGWERRAEIIKRFTEPLHLTYSTSYIFDVVVWKYKIKQNPTLCWADNSGAVTKYSIELVSFIKKLPQREIDEAIEERKTFNRLKKQERER
jgi:hypothetical protein